ncbi:hypothetical protein N7481_008701 [Penicillium waksmanii]|uniref:uncharacterized protein n=1 Tax=Penicillium waksmanii TaxID=69791 RepID=UPI00254750FB|nr:uncharacterized protein N7481_008701 [Penicillium waksmanii]KAJ5974994.1 hypothetical protein N7481_008701 [Penicillium waksmanii]
MFNQSSETYDLKLDQACIFLQDRIKTSINGTFHVNLPHKNSFKSIQVKLVGILKIPRDDYLIRNDRQLITSISHQSIGASKTLNSFQLPAGNYEFPFNIPLAGRILETVTGQRHMYHTYHVQAIVERRFKADSVVSRPIRVYRYPHLSTEPQTTSIPTTIERQSGQEMQYCISIPESNIPFGSKFQAKCYFSPLSKNLSLKTISVSVLEKHSLQIDATAAESAMHGILKLNSNRTSTIFEAEHDFSNQIPDTSLIEIDGGDGDIPSAEWPLSLPVQLPESFDFASQSVSTSIIRISHELVIQAHFQNTETNTPILIQERIPFSIYMTPAVIGDDGTIYGQDLECFQSYENAPPAYGRHKCDAIPVEWFGYLNQLSAERARMSSEQCFQPAIGSVSCVPIAGVSLETEPPAYQFCST